MSLDLDFAGRMQKIRAHYTMSLRSVFEAVANSFDATESLGEQGRITVRILLDEDKSSLFNREEKQYVLRGYEVEDNGVGFIDEHMGYFKKSDTTNKIGGKGVGRFLWLKVFGGVQVISEYKEGGKWWRRDFPFSLATGVEDKDLVPQKLDAGVQKTIIRLTNPEKERLPYLESDSNMMAARLLEHFLLYFAVLKGQPKVSVISDADNVVVDVGGMYQEVIGSRHKQEKIEVAGHIFELHHLFVKPTAARKNLIRFCARRRVVMSESVTVVVQEVNVYKPVTLENFRYHAYITGDYIDDNTDDTRSDVGFGKPTSSKEEIEDGDDQLSLLVEEPDEAEAEGVTKEALYQSIGEKIRAHLGEHIADVKKKKERQIEEFAHKEQPQFRPFVAAAKQKLDRLPARPTKRDIEIALYQAKIDGRADLDKAVAEIVKKVVTADQVAQHRKQLIDKFAAEANRHAMSALAEYVCTRRAVIDVLKANLGKQDGEGFEDEAIIHDLFFPRYITSDVIPVGPLDPGEREIENLWLLDERLVFHRLLTSDKPLSTLKKLLVAGKATIADISQKNDEPDILIFDPAFVTAESDDYGSLGIVEFKKPGRNDYTDASNPIKQILDIARKIRDGKQVETKTGQIQAISKDVRFYGYAVCDVLSTLRPIIEDTYRMDHAPDGIGYFMFHDKLNLVLEVIPYSKVVEDAERRNAAFFKKLNM